MKSTPTGLQVASSSSPVPATWRTLHGAVLRPPLMQWDGARYTGARLAKLNDTEAAQLTGVVSVVRHGDFVGVVASQPQQAQRACSLLDATWQLPVDAQASSHTALPGAGASTEASSSGAPAFQRSYGWQANAAGKPACAIAEYDGQQLSVWASVADSLKLRDELAQLCELAPSAVHIFAWREGDAYDTAVDAALLSRHTGRAVRVQAQADTLSSDLQIQWAARGAPGAALYQAQGPYAQAWRPSVAALLCGLQHTIPTGIRLSPDTLNEQADSGALTSVTLTSHTSNDDTLAVQVFARESFFDEYWRDQSQDPLQARLDELQDDTGRALIRSVAERADWAGQAPKPGQGRGFAYAHIVDDTKQPPSQVWSAWVADVAVDPQSGAIQLTGLTVGHDARGLDTEPSSRQTLEDHIRGSATRWLQASPSYDSWGGASEDASSNAQSTSIQLAQPSVPTAPAEPLFWHRGAELPAAAAIANAIHQATGIRIRQAPFDTQALQRQLLQGDSKAFSWKRSLAWLGGAAAAVGGVLLTAMPWRPAIAPLAAVDTSIYSEQAIARGRLVAIAGDCVVCHTAKGGQENAGGLALDTPFGSVYTTNITPDVETGIGSWSYAAFERAMRQGIHQDGRHLYPAFPYTAFAKISDTDMQALYAYLMTQEPVSYKPPETQLAFPYNLRPTLAGWNLLYHDPKPYVPDTTQTTLWNRGAYLVQGAGHCAACHSPRNALGAEKTGEHFLAGNVIDGWEAPALNALSKAPIPWTEASLYAYLRTGYSPLHGVAAGPMAPVVHGLSQLPDEDVRAMAHYLATLAAPDSNTASQAQQAALLEQRSRENEAVMLLPGERLFEGACAVCHDSRDGPPLFGARPSLALNTNLHSQLPDNVIQVLLHGVEEPALPSMGYMPGFKDSLNDKQLEDLLVYMRQRFAPDQPAWEDLPEKIKALRAAPKH
ncbi:c-type cytochrome [Pusillimonas sp. CC-YST705]|uniref:C-type cytochrome n=1 Tax=Mesopusillimonas faecipullorum TaxID=2755040 RepID=A0ABS8CFX4_9BURK|nr:molybdopterin-dependent oxidoreductase [Mesopusillimonas faecipullorum]MCB5364464.1 c-type cytochrome [Mesopusillimonas faecipullorum]